MFDEWRHNLYMQPKIKIHKSNNQQKKQNKSWPKKQKQKTKTKKQKQKQKNTLVKNWQTLLSILSNN